MSTLSSRSGAGISSSSNPSIPQQQSGQSVAPSPISTTITSSKKNQIADFSYCLSSEIRLDVRLKLECLEGVLPSRRTSTPSSSSSEKTKIDTTGQKNSSSSGKSSNNPFLEPQETTRTTAKDFDDAIESLLQDTTADNTPLTDISFTFQLFAENKPLCIPIRTRSKSYESQLLWNEWILFPVSYSALPVSTQLVVTIWALEGPRKPIPIGGSTFRLFGKNNMIRKGRHKLFMWPWKEGDGQSLTTTPSKIPALQEMTRLEKMTRKYERGDMLKVDWMDKLVFQEIENINQKVYLETKAMQLVIELPSFDLPLIFNEQEYTFPSEMSLRHLENEIVTIFDGEIYQDNPVENKHRRLVRSHRNGPLDRELKPNAKIRDDLHRIIRYPPTKELSLEEKDLLWKFRFYLTRNKKALTKFLKCVTWTDAFEARQAVDLLSVWLDIDVEDALELLGPGFKDADVRSYAVMQLKKSDDEELQLYLLQLVQAIKFEGLTERSSISDSPLAEFLIERGIRNPVLGVSLHWYLVVECEDKDVGKIYAKVAFHFMTAMMEIPDGMNRRDVLRRQGELVASLSNLSRELRNSKESRPKKIERLRAYISDPKQGLLSFPPLPLPLDATVHVTGILPDKATIFKSALLPLKLTFSCLDGSEYTIIFKTGDDLRQDQLVVQIITLMDRLLRKENLDLKLMPYKVLATGTDQGMLQYIPSQPIASILAQYSNSLVAYLKSNQVTQETYTHAPNQSSSSSSSTGIGGTVSTSSSGGGLSNLAAGSGTNSSTGPAGQDVPPHIMDTYIRSTSGYCVITYLLGVGDRHLDNLLLTQQGNLFHIDFGFLLGRDPKPFPPPMKLCKEMVEAMGGALSPNYSKFRSYCFIAFNNLRKSANLILNLFTLMVNANIPDIAIEPDKAVFKVQERFRLDLNDEEAIQYLHSLILESVSAFFPQVMEQLHKVAQLLRS